MTEEERLELLKRNSPYVLPDDPSLSGWTTQQIKEKFYQGLFVMNQFLEELRTEFVEGAESVDQKIAALIAQLNDGTITVLKANQDSYGNSIYDTYFTKTAANGKVNTTDVDVLATANKIAKRDANGQLNVPQTPTAEGHSTSKKYVDDNIVTAIENLVDDLEDATIIVKKAYEDEDGLNIADSYAKITALTQEIAKITNGTYIAAKATSDKDGNQIDTTYVKKANIVNDLTHTDTDKPLSANQGKVLKGLIDGINQILESPDTDLDTLREVVAYIKEHQSLIEGITTTKVNYTDIVNNLTTAVEKKVLDARQGKALDEAKINYTDIVDNLTTNDATKPLSAKQGKALNDAKQDVLVNQQNIKSLGGYSLLGEGNLDVFILTQLDDELSPTSHNPVINSAIYAAVNAKANQTALENGTIVVGKATQDANGNVINTYYATKDEIGALSYIEDVSVSGNTLTLERNNGQTVTFVGNDFTSTQVTLEEGE